MFAYLFRQIKLRSLNNMPRVPQIWLFLLSPDITFINVIPVHCRLRSREGFFSGIRQSCSMPFVTTEIQWEMNAAQNTKAQYAPVSWQTGKQGCSKLKVEQWGVLLEQKSGSCLFAKSQLSPGSGALLEALTSHQYLKYLCIVLYSFQI